MALVENPCAREIYRILADDKLNKDEGVDFGTIKTHLAPVYQASEIGKMLGEMEMIGVASRKRDNDTGERSPTKYEVSKETEWSALFARTLGYDPIALGIPEDIANK
jgi:hypothetical protein